MKRNFQRITVSIYLFLLSFGFSFSQCVIPTSDLDEMFYISPPTEQEQHNALQHIFCGEVRHYTDQNGIPKIQIGGCHFKPPEYDRSKSFPCMKVQYASP